jgi:CDP-glucose 4,6-dehydratase
VGHGPRPLEAVGVSLPDPKFWAGRRVLLTGHTGFKGAWLALWLEFLGARVTGFALDPEAAPSVFHATTPLADAADRRGDLRDPAAVQAAVHAADPEIVLHLAAQALVGRGWADPIGTYASNVTGTLNLLAALRGQKNLRAVLVVTSDKVFRNDDSGTAFTEDAPLGGDDPYSASKAACEIAVAPLRQAWFAGIGLGTARAGNVIGGGDAGEGRLLPDCWRAARAGETLVLRRPDSTRPWQHVLDCLRGYLLYAEGLATRADAPPALNFGPPPTAHAATAREVAEAMLRRLGNGGWAPAEGPTINEKQHLSLDPARAAATLGWRTALAVEPAVELTAAWCRAHDAGADMRAFTLAQISAHTRRAAAA